MLTFRSAVFQAGGLVVVLVEVGRKAYLASIVPVIINAILNEHQLVADIVAFVAKGDFPRSRLGEKQRGKILASWVTRKMPTMAQFGIRDPDGPDSQITTVTEERSSIRAGSVAGGSTTLRDSMISNNTLPERGASLGPGVVELPAYGSSILDSPPPIVDPNRFELDNDITPTAPPANFSLPAPSRDGYFGHAPPLGERDPLKTPLAELPVFEPSIKPLPQPLLSYASKPTLSFSNNISGRGSLDLGDDMGYAVDGGYTGGGEYQPYRPGTEVGSNGYVGRAGGGALKVADLDSEQDWSMGASRHVESGPPGW